MSEQADLTRLADRLAALTPAARPPDRDRLLIALGRAQGRRAVGFWRATAGVFALLSAGLAWQLAAPEPQRVTERIWLAPPAEPLTPSAEPAPLPEGGLWRLRLRVFEGGGEALPDRVPLGPAEPPAELRAFGPRLPV